MNKKIIRAATFAVFLGCVGFAPRVVAEEKPAAVAPTDGAVEAAKQFLATLSEAQRATVLFAFTDEAQRKRWSNFPDGIFQRAGLQLGDLTAPQRAAALKVLVAVLSQSGYEKIMQIVEADEALKLAESGNKKGPPGFNGPPGPPPGDPNGGGPDPSGPGSGPGHPTDDKGGDQGPGPRGGGPGGGGLLFGHDKYYISFLGQPSATAPWMIQFGGHHLGINVTLVGERGTLAPSHTGAQPAIYEIEGKTVRPLGREVDKAHALLDSLDETQRKQAVLNFKMRDLVLGPGRDSRTIEPEGIQGSSLTERQCALLLDLAGEWSGILNDTMADAKMAELKKNVADTWFAWSGPTEIGRAAYFRIQGPTVWIEFAPQTLGGDATKHIHTIYRDPTNDYGKAWGKP